MPAKSFKSSSYSYNKNKQKIRLEVPDYKFNNSLKYKRKLILRLQCKYRARGILALALCNFLIISN